MFSIVRAGGVVMSLIVLIASGDASPPASYDLQRTLEVARSGSPENLKADSVESQFRWKKAETYSGFLPSVSLAGNYLFDKKYAYTDIVLGGNYSSVPQIIPNAQAVLTAQLPVFDGFSSTNRYLSASAFHRSAQYQQDWTHFKTNREITLQFYRALSAKTLRDVAIQNLKIIEDHLKDSRLFKNAGLSTHYDVLRVEVQVSEAQSELLNAEDNVELEKNKLAEMIGTNETIGDVNGNLPVFPESLLNEGLKFTPNKRQDLQAQLDAERGFDRQEAFSSTYWVPKVSLFYQHQKYNNLTTGFSDWDKYRTAYQFGISASWNIFDGFSSFSKSKQSIEERKQAEIRTQTIYRSAKTDFDFWKRKFDYFTSVYRARSGDVEKASEAVRLAREGHKVGARTNTDLLDVELDLFRSRANVVKAQLGAIEALLKLELATGQKLYSFF